MLSLCMSFIILGASSWQYAWRQVC